jgi:hypothetical protein
MCGNSGRENREVLLVSSGIGDLFTARRHAGRRGSDGHDSSSISAMGIDPQRDGRKMASQHANLAGQKMLEDRGLKFSATSIAAPRSLRLH